MIREINNLILTTAPRYSVADKAPSTELELFTTPTLVVWSGASNHTIFRDARVNWAFRALHDQLHLDTGLGFSPAEEVELGRIQANKYSGLFADLIYIEVALQAKYYANTGLFVVDQVDFDLKHLKRMGYNV
jgi:hypothetical protein